MFAVIRTGGKQYKVASGDVIAVERLAGEPGDMIELGDVLMLGEDGKAPTVGAPTVAKAAVFGEVLDQEKADKIIVFKKQRRQNHRRKQGHRQSLTRVRVLAVSPDGAKPAHTPTKKAEPKPAAEGAEDSATKGSAKKSAAKKTAAKKTATKKTAKKAAAKKTAAKKDTAKKDTATKSGAKKTAAKKAAKKSGDD